MTMHNKESKKNSKKRKSSRYKSELVMELLRGEPIEEVARREGLGVHELAGWREIFIKNGMHGFKKNPELSKLKEAQRLIGRLTMENELIKKKIELNQNDHGTS